MEGCMCVGAAAGLRALDATTAAKSGLRMTPSLTPSTTDWRASSGSAGTSQPDTSTCWKPCAASSACQLVRLMSGEPAGQGYLYVNVRTNQSSCVLVSKFGGVQCVMACRLPDRHQLERCHPVRVLHVHRLSKHI